MILGRTVLPFSIQKICFCSLSLGLTLIVWAIVTELVWSCQRNVEVRVMAVLQ